MDFDFEDSNKSFKSYLKGILLYAIWFTCFMAFEPWALDILHIKSRSIFKNVLGFIIPILVYYRLTLLMGKIKQKNYYLIQIIGTMLGGFVLLVIILVLKIRR